MRSKFPATKLTEEQRVAKQTGADAERRRLARDAGRICFDLYAPFTGDILHSSLRIRRLVATMYPCIILDEFQDTNGPQWRVVQALGQSCRLLALADPEQRIFDWIGADPARLDQFRAAFTPDVVDLSTDNHRSAGTEIAKFGNDVLAGHFRQKAYVGVHVESFTPFAAPAMTKLVTTVYAARKRLLDQAVERWSVAVLVPTKRLTRLVSDALRKGKQFDEVIVFEGWPTKVKGAPPHNPDRIVRFNSKDEVNDQARQILRVSVTRARRRTTVLTPQGDPCILLGI